MSELPKNKGELSRTPGDHLFWYVQAFRSGPILWGQCRFCDRLVPNKAMPIHPDRKAEFSPRIAFEPCAHLVTTIDHVETPMLIFTNAVDTVKHDIDLTVWPGWRHYWPLIRHRIFAIPCLLAAICMAVIPPRTKAPDIQPAHNRVMIARDPAHWQPLPMIHLPAGMKDKVYCHPWRDGWRCVWKEAAYAPAR